MLLAPMPGSIRLVGTPRRVSLRDLQPSQLYVAKDKLEAVLAVWSDREAASLEPVTVRRYGDRLVTTDGHTRALAAYRAGLDAIYVIDDVDDIDDTAYEICVGWCLTEGVRSVADLDDRVVDGSAYERLWLARCRQMHRDLGRT